MADTAALALADRVGEEEKVVVQVGVAEEVVVEEEGGGCEVFGINGCGVLCV